MSGKGECVIPAVSKGRLASIPRKFSGIISPGIGVGMGRMVCMGNQPELSGFHLGP